MRKESKEFDDKGTDKGNPDSNIIDMIVMIVKSKK